MQDIAPELLEKIQKTFREKIAQNKKLEAISKRISENNGSYREAAELSVEVGKALSEAFAEHLSGESLPDGKMYYNIAERILNPTLKENHRIISDASSKVQESLNKKANIRMRAVRPKVNQDKIDGIVNRISAEAVYDEVAWILQEPIVNFSESIVDEFIKENVSFHHKVGLKPKIVRTAEPGACEWCRGVEGEYFYPDVPKDVFRRHDFCRCIVDYTPGDGKWQNVHNKKWKKDKLDVEEYENEINKRKRKKEYLINKTKINSNEYRRKFDKITEDKKLNRLIYTKAKEMLYHRNGTKIEDMYWFDLKTGEIIAKQIGETEEECIRYTKSIKRKIKNKKDLITIHTHPSSMPPSISDLNSSIRNGYKKGIIVTHDGRVFLYEVGEKETFNSRINLMNIAKHKKIGYNEFDAQLKALEEICKKNNVRVEELL